MGENNETRMYAEQMKKDNVPVVYYRMRKQWGIDGDVCKVYQRANSPARNKGREVGSDVDIVDPVIKTKA